MKKGNLHVFHNTFYHKTGWQMSILEASDPEPDPTQKVRIRNTGFNTGRVDCTTLTPFCF
jgi:hypothetical protein